MTKFYIYQKDTKQQIDPSMILLGGGDTVLTGEALIAVEKDGGNKHEIWVNEIRVCAIKGKPVDIIETLLNGTYTNYAYRCKTDHDLYVAMDIPKEKQKKDAPVVTITKSLLSLVPTGNTGDFAQLAQSIFNLSKDAHGALKTERDKDWTVYIATSPNNKAVKLHKTRYLFHNESDHLQFGALALLIADWLGFDNKELDKMLTKMQRI